MSNFTNEMDKCCREGSAYVETCGDDNNVCVLACTFGTWINKSVAEAGGESAMAKVFVPYANKGTAFPKGERAFFSEGTYLHNLGNFANSGVVIPSCDVFAVNVSFEQLAAKCCADCDVAPVYKEANGETFLVIGEEGSKERRLAEQALGFRAVFSGDLAFFLGDRRVRVRRSANDMMRLLKRSIKFASGVVVHEDGALGYEAKVLSDDFNVTVTYYDEKCGKWSTEPCDTLEVGVGELTMRLLAKV